MILHCFKTNKKEFWKKRKVRKEKGREQMKWMNWKKIKIKRKDSKKERNDRKNVREVTKKRERKGQQKIREKKQGKRKGGDKKGMEGKEQSGKERKEIMGKQRQRDGKERERGWGRGRGRKGKKADRETPLITHCRCEFSFSLVLVHSFYLSLRQNFFSFVSLQIGRCWSHSRVLGCTTWSDGKQVLLSPQWIRVQIDALSSEQASLTKTFCS